ncbi:MAG: hypothetical protein II943_09180 [Victivallales bacterium]|nr:hypothetical protein [Victivallales bacterium]
MKKLSLALLIALCAGMFTFTSCDSAEDDFDKAMKEAEADFQKAVDEAEAEGQKAIDNAVESLPKD